MFSPSRQNSIFKYSPLDMPALPLFRDEVKDDKAEKRQATEKEVFMSFYKFLKGIPADTKGHILTARCLEWAHSFDPKDRDLTDNVWMSFLSDYDHAMTVGSDAFTVAREMLLYQLLITDDAEKLIKRQGLLRDLEKDHPFKKRAAKKRGGGGGGGGGKAGVAADKKEKQRSGS